ncbi:hypothetical protein Lal_00022867 [Lupinus albus]|nr:hypothetical protein Lal_00022867 [Lupinus albus]
MNHVWSVRETNSPLPYAITIYNILEHFGVSTTDESKITLNPRDSMIDVDVIHKMGFFRDLTDRIYKSQSDKSAALDDPTANVSVNPPAQQPSNFHTESSSSAQMPSNQMIMDELFSLRGYISNWMDALDAQNQQVQIELQHLSSKINMMDLDEDSYEPKHITPNQRGIIQNKGSILKSCRIPQSILLSENYIVKKILVCHHQKGGDCEEDLALDLGMV